MEKSEIMEEKNGEKEEEWMSKRRSRSLHRRR